MSLRDLEARAKEKLDRKIYDYFAGGSGDEVTLASNKSAFDRLALIPRVLRGVTEPSLATTVLGRRIAAPIMLAPIGHLRLAHPEGERAVARAATGFGTLFSMSTVASTRIEELGAAPFWMQLYIFQDREESARLIRRAEQAGATALMVTVDVPRLGKRQRDLDNAFALPPGIEAVNVPRAELLNQAEVGTSAIARHTSSCFDPALTWDVLAWIKSVSALPLIVKGILSADDARLAIDHGASAVVVSNHGGRQLDGAPATIDVLPEIARAVGGRAEVYLDGGVRRGIDVVRALALGARAVLIGRPYVWSLAVGGEAGVRALLDELAEELATALVLLGRGRIEELDPSVLRS